MEGFFFGKEVIVGGEPLKAPLYALSSYQYSRKIFGPGNGALNVCSSQLEFLHASQQEARDKG